VAAAVHLKLSMVLVSYLEKVYRNWKHAYMWMRSEIKSVQKSLMPKCPSLIATVHSLPDGIAISSTSRIALHGLKGLGGERNWKILHSIDLTLGMAW
jgi:hypothetical protein